MKKFKKEIYSSIDKTNDSIYIYTDIEDVLQCKAGIKVGIYILKEVKTLVKSPQLI